MGTQQEAINAINSGENVDLSGAAGYGKSWVIEQVIDKYTIVAAPTGIAALNVGGETCHSIFGLPYGIPSEEDKAKRTRTFTNLFTGDHVKRLVIDECFKGGTEVLTKRGFIRFDKLLEGEEVAQFDADSKEIDFSIPTRYISKDYEGDMVNIKSTHKIDITCTANHELLLYNTTNSKYEKVKAKDFKPSSRNLMLTSGRIKDEGKCLSTMEKLAIAFQADGYTKGKYSMNLSAVNMVKKRFGYTPKEDHCTVVFRFRKESKIKRFIEDFSDLDIVRYDNPNSNQEKFTIKNIPMKYINKDFKEVFELGDFCLSKAKEFLTYVQHWDGLQGVNKSGGYCNTNKSSIDFVQSLCCLAGYTGNVSRIPDNRKDSYKDHYKLYFREDCDYITTQNISKEVFNYKGKVYCVEMPKGNIIIRSGRSTHVVGNCSMLRADHLDLIDHKLRLIKQNNKPFGGLQMILVGDLWQLPCIIGADEKRIYRRLYDSGFIFDSNVWEEANFKSIVLTEAKRQEDEAQVSLLNAIRTKGKHWKEAVVRLNEWCVAEHDHHTLHLCSYNKDADKINKLHYDENTNPTKLYLADIEGDFNSRDCIVNSSISLKDGLRVILCANCPDKTYRNGQMGVVTFMGGNYIEVKLDSGERVEVVPNEWESFKYSRGISGVQKKSTGKFKQMPLRQAGAISINKAQGLTLDSICVNLGSRSRTALTYVALSRVRDLRNISLARPITEDDIIISARVGKFYKGLEEN